MEIEPIPLDLKDIRKELETLKKIDTIQKRKQNWKSVILEFEKYNQEVIYCYRCGKIDIVGNGDCYCKDEAKILKEKNKLFHAIVGRIKSACEFYLRYKDNPKLLIEEYPEYEKEIEKFNSDKHLYQEFDKYTAVSLKEYNEWLFRLAFKDVLEND